MDECGTRIINRTTCDVIESFRLQNNLSDTLASPPPPPGIFSNLTFESFVDFYLISTLCFVGIFCNVISVVVLQKDKERREFLFLLQALAVADAAYLSVSLLRYPLKYVLPRRDDYNVMQPYVFPALKACQTICIWMMVLVTVDRFMCVCKPFRAQTLFTGRARRCYAMATFIAGFLYNIPRFFDSCVMKWVDVCTNTTWTRMAYTPTFHNTLYYDIYLYGMYIYLLYMGPLGILFFMNMRLVQAIKLSRRRMRNRSVRGNGSPKLQHAGSSNSSSPPPSDGGLSDNSATLVLVVIVVVFIVCETPELILKIISLVERHFHYEIFSPELFRFSELLMVLNSSVNFFIYLFFGRRFRHILKDTFRVKFLFSTSGTATTKETIPLQYHHNCIHAKRHSRRHVAV